MEDLVGQVMSTSASSSKKKIQPGLGFTTTAARYDYKWNELQGDFSKL
jgi:hypothetical protein